jgi:hypothetical protein
LNCKFQEIDHGDPSAGIEREEAGQKFKARGEAREEVELKWLPET